MMGSGFGIFIPQPPPPFPFHPPTPPPPSFGISISDPKIISSVSEHQTEPPRREKHLPYQKHAHSDDKKSEAEIKAFEKRSLATIRISLRGE